MWEVTRLSDLYSVLHFAILPKPASSGPSATPNPPSLAESITCGALTTRPLLDALASAGFDNASLTPSTAAVFTAILPMSSGYVSRSDFLELRLLDCPLPIAAIKSSLRPLERYRTVWSLDLSFGTAQSLAGLVEHAAGVVQWGGDGNPVLAAADGFSAHLLDVSRQLFDRLHNAAWLSPNPLPRHRLALIRGRPNITAGGPVYRTAAALGIDLVIVDEEDHWLQANTAENRQHRESFLAIDMTEDSSLAKRIAKVIKAYPLPIHGLFTLSDNYFVDVARAALLLCAPTPPISAFCASVDKYRSRLLQDTPGQTARVSSVAELEALMTAARADGSPAFSPKFPLIVKPTKGWSSECVSKVNGPAELAIAVDKAIKRHGTAAVIEPFFDGPEIDVNFVLLNGEILFSEIADEPPCQADASDATVDATFSPEALTMPSALPDDEQELAKRTMRDILVDMGFHTGVFHVEARMTNSACEYRDLGNGVVDLVRKSTAPTERPVCRLVEINARPPGYRVTVPSKHTYGVDYFAAHMLAALGDGERLRMVTQPFQPLLRPGNQSSQYFSRLVYIPAPAEGTVRWDAESGLSPCEELKRRRPDLAKHIVLAVDYCQPGDRISLYTDGARTYVAHLLVSSGWSRRQAIEVGNEVQKSYRIQVDAA